MKIGSVVAVWLIRYGKKLSTRRLKPWEIQGHNFYTFSQRTKLMGYCPDVLLQKNNSQTQSQNNRERDVNRSTTDIGAVSGV